MTAEQETSSFTLDERHRLQRRAIALNSGIVLLSLATGGLTADILQLYAIQVLHLSPGQLGLALGLLPLTVVVQLPAVNLVRKKSPRRVMQAGYGVVLSALVPLGLLPEIRSAEPALLFPIFILLLFVIELAISCSWAAVWFAWTRTFAMTGERGGFLGRMRFASQLVAGGAILGLTVVLHERMTAVDYQCLVGILAAYLGSAILALKKLPVVAGFVDDEEAEEQRSWKQLAGIARDSRLRAPVLLAALAALLTVPLATTYAATVLHFPASVVAAALLSRTIVNVAVARPLGNMVDHLGYERVALRALLLAVLSATAWIFVGPSHHPISPATVLYVALFVLSTIGVNGLGMAANLWLSTEVNQSVAVVAFTALDVVGIAVLQLWLFVGGVMVDWSEHARIVNTSGLHVDPFKVSLLCVAGVGLVVALRMLRRPLGNVPPPTS